MNDNIIPFPSQAKNNSDDGGFFARCPQCESFQWELEVDAIEVEKIIAFHCGNPDCGYTLPLIMNIKLIDPNKEEVFTITTDDGKQVSCIIKDVDIDTFISLSESNDGNDDDER